MVTRFWGEVFEGVEEVILSEILCIILCSLLSLYQYLIKRYFRYRRFLNSIGICADEIYPIEAYDWFRRCWIWRYLHALLHFMRLITRLYL